MPTKRKGMNPHQKAVCREGERRAGRDQIAELLEKSRSEDADQRCEAAESLCPCHVRRRIPEVWSALYRMLEDADVRVRRAAWHTLEDGGRPDDPVLDAIITRTLERETDRTVRRFAERFAAAHRERETHVERAAVQYRPERGKCDFCGREGVPVERDASVEIPAGDHYRPAWACAECR